MESQIHSPLASLLKGLRYLETSQQTIDFANQWLVKNYCLFGSTYAALQSGKGFGVKWLSWSPPDLFTSKVHEVDFNEISLVYQRSSQPRIITNTEMRQINPETTEWAERNHIQSSMSIPIQFEKDINGIFILYRSADQPPFGSEDLQMAGEVAILLSNVLKWQIRVEVSEKKNNELDQMLRASLSMTESLELEAVLNAILINALKLLPLVNDAHIFLYDNDKLQFGAALFQDGSTGKAWAEPRQNGLTYTVARSGEMILVKDMCNHPLFANSPEGWCGSIIGIPLIVNHNVLGVMTLAKLAPGSINNHEVEILNRLAIQAAHVIQNVHMHAEIALQAFTDPLTNLANRRSFEWEAQKTLDLARRYERTFCVAMLDFNGFKRINDTYGHATGDDSLRLLAQCMSDTLRKTDFLARFGGDEFIILFPESTRGQARETIELLLERVRNCQVPVRPLISECLSFSYGLASYPDDGLELPELIYLADQLLYKAKENVPPPAV